MEAEDREELGGEEKEVREWRKRMRWKRKMRWIKEEGNDMGLFTTHPFI